MALSQSICCSQDITPPQRKCIGGEQQRGGAWKGEKEKEREKGEEQKYEGGQNVLLEYGIDFFSFLFKLTFY